MIGNQRKFSEKKGIKTKENNKHKQKKNWNLIPWNDRGKESKFLQEQGKRTNKQHDKKRGDSKGGLSLRGGKTGSISTPHVLRISRAREMNPAFSEKRKKEKKRKEKKIKHWYT